MANRAHEVEQIKFHGTTMLLRVDGKEHRIDIASQSQRLAAASPEQRDHFVISPSGYGIHWPDLDEDLSIDGLIGIMHCRNSGNQEFSVRKAA
ncbi:MAG: DUF2442 domain-containing protein [Candidatus Sumerlaeota bacterium]|nr:DUF2442 domain-containing protein [Candidatus Sumerlaeota bacterium]